MSTQEDGAQKNSIVVRQQVSGGPANVIVKSVTNKSITNVPTSRSVVFNNGQVLGNFSVFFFSCYQTQKVVLIAQSDIIDIFVLTNVTQLSHS